MKESNVVLVARVDDIQRFQTVATYSTVVPVIHADEEDPAMIAEMALEIAGDIDKTWGKY